MFSHLQCVLAVVFPDAHSFCSQLSRPYCFVCFPEEQAKPQFLSGLFVPVLVDFLVPPVFLFVRHCHRLLHRLRHLPFEKTVAEKKKIQSGADYYPHFGSLDHSAHAKVKPAKSSSSGGLSDRSFPLCFSLKSATELFKTSWANLKKSRSFPFSIFSRRGMACTVASVVVAAAALVAVVALRVVRHALTPEDAGSSDLLVRSLISLISSSLPHPVLPEYSASDSADV